MKYALNEFTQEGLDLASQTLDAIRAGNSPSFDDLLSQPRYSNPFEPHVEIEVREFETRREIGESLSRSFEVAGISPASVIDRYNVWSWIAMRYIAPDDLNGVADLAQASDQAFVYNPSRDTGIQAVRAQWRNYARLAYEIYTQHGEKAWLMLDQRPKSLPHFTMRLVQNREAFRSKGIIHLNHLLYADPETGDTKPGAIALQRSKAPPGSQPRLLDVLTQLNMNYDVYGMNAERLIEILPPEFDHFRLQTGSSQPPN